MAHDHRSFALPLPLKDSAAPKRRSEWRAVGMLVPYLREFRFRVAIALAFLTAAKLANVGVPLILKDVVDSLDAQTAVLELPLALPAAYGILRVSTSLSAWLLPSGAWKSAARRTRWIRRPSRARSTACSTTKR